MALTTLFLVQTFHEEKGQLVGNEPFECITREAALNWATHLAPRKSGVVAWAQSGDPQAGPRQILFKDGQVPTGFRGLGA